MKTLDALRAAVPEATIYFARELTKLHEELLTGTAVELAQILQAEPVKQKGEFVVLVESQK